MVSRSLQVCKSGIQSERCGSKIRDQLEHAQNPLGPAGTSTKFLGSTTPLANPSQEHPLQLPEERLEEVSPFQQKHLPPGGGNLEYLGSVGHVWWDKVAPLPRVRAGAVGCGMGQPGILRDKGEMNSLFEMATKGMRHTIQSIF